MHDGLEGDHVSRLLRGLPAVAPSRAFGDGTRE
jgi:hypothetical protein